MSKKEIDPLNQLVPSLKTDFEKINKRLNIKPIGHEDIQDFIEAIETEEDLETALHEVVRALVERRIPLAQLHAMVDEALSNMDYL